MTECIIENKGFFNEVFYETAQIIYDNSIFCLFNDRAFKKSLEEAKSENSLLHGLKAAVINFGPKTAVFLIFHQIFSYSDFPIVLPPKTTLTFYKVVFIAPLIEEIAFRFIFQNTIRFSQHCLNQIAHKTLPETWAEGRVLTVITSTQTRIVATSIIFAGLHLTNAPVLAANTLALMTTIIILPTMSMCYERKGFTASLAAHMAHNCFSL